MNRGMAGRNVIPTPLHCGRDPAVGRNMKAVQLTLATPHANMKLCERIDRVLTLRADLPWPFVCAALVGNGAMEPVTSELEHEHELHVVAVCSCATS